MAGGGSLRSNHEYHYDESKFKGFWRYMNSETPNGRAYGSMIILGVWATFIGGIIMYKKSKKPSQ